MSRTTISREDLLEDLHKIAKVVGHPPSLSEYTAAGGEYSSKPFRTNFGSWGAALVEGGYIPQKGGGGSPFIQEPINLPSYTNRGEITIKGDAIIGFDLHTPYHDHKLLEKLIQVKHSLGINTLILGGDITEFKSLFFKDGQDAEFSWTEEMKHTKNLMKKLTDVFETVYWIKGNHDNRLAKLLNSNKQMMEVYEMILDFPNLKMLDTYYCEVNEWLLINHPTRCRKNKTSFIEELSNRYRKSVVQGHSHRFAFAVSDSGHDVLGEGLHLTEPDLHEYKSRELGTHSEWVGGFWIMRGRTLTPYVQHAHISNVGIEKV